MQKIIPHKKPKYANRDTWHQAYHNQLIIIHIIIKRIISQNFNLNIVWDRPSIFNNLSRLIYHCSSKYISPYIDDIVEEEDNSLSYQRG